MTSDSNDTDESDVEPRFLQKAKEKTQSTEVMVAHSQEMKREESAYPKCRRDAVFANRLFEKTRK
jgi:hypothetical protein